MKLSAKQVAALVVLDIAKGPVLLPHTWDHAEWYTERKTSLSSFQALERKGLAERRDRIFWYITKEGKRTLAFREVEPNCLPFTSQPAPEPPPGDERPWNPPPPPMATEETFTVGLTEKEIQFIVKAMVHSANIHKLFCEQGSEDYPLKETNAYINEVNRLRKILEAA